MKGLQAALVALALAFMGVAVVRQWQAIPEVTWSIRPGLLVISLLALVAVFFVNAYGWHLILASVGRPLPYRLSVRIWLLSSVTRYLPGGIWGYASRAAMARGVGVDLSMSGVSLYLETLLVTATAITSGLGTMLLCSSLPISPIHALGACGVCTVLLHPRVIGLARLLPGRVGKAFLGVQLPQWRQLLGLYAYYLTFWFAFGLVFALFVNSVYPIYIGHWPYVAASLGLAFSVGFLAVMFPGGIGVRESVLYLLLTNIMPPTASLVVALTSRVWNIVGELVSVGLVTAWRKD